MAVVDERTGYDDWSDLSENGSSSTLLDTTSVGNLKEFSGTATGYVGADDLADYMQFALDDPAKLIFTIDSTDAAKFTIYTLVEKTSKDQTTYSLKALQSTSVKKPKNTPATETESKALLLESGTYYIKVEATDKKKGEANYSFSLNRNKSHFYINCCNADDWTDLKTAGAFGAVDVNTVGSITSVRDVITDGYVGFGDAVDYFQFTLDDAAKLFFDVDAGDAAKFTIYTLVGKTSKGKTTYSLKSLQSSTLKKPKNGTLFEVETKGLLLESGTYYIGIQSTNAKKGNEAYYNVSVNNNTIFYVNGDAGTDNVLYDKKNKELNPDIEFAGTICNSGGLEFAAEEEANWVGFGDDADHYEFSVENDMSVFFNVSATDAAKFVVYQFVDGKLKTLQTTTVKAGDYVSTRELKLSADGEYYVGITSTNAKKGGNAWYNITGEIYAAPMVAVIKSEEDYDSSIAGKFTNNADKVTFNGNIEFMGVGDPFDFKGGDDQLIFKKSSEEGRIEFWNGINMGDGDDKITLGADTEVYADIDFGAGNDTFQFEKDSDFECSLLDFGAGNDLLDTQKNSDVSIGTIDFGAGNDKFIVGSDTYIEKSYYGSTTIDFGTGDDTFQIDKKGCVFTDVLSFGDGNDTLILKGNLWVFGDTDFSDLEKVSGNGQLFVRYCAEEGQYRKFTDAGIKVWCIDGAEFFSDSKAELADNTKSGARNMYDAGDDEYEADIWLCGEELGSQPYGFVDTVDYLKFKKNDDFSTLRIEDGSGFATLELKNDKDEKIETFEVYSGCSITLDDYTENGKTYYLKFSVTDSGSFSGEAYFC